MTNNVLIINNTIAPYRKPIFELLVEKLNKYNMSTEILYLTEKESVRQWDVGVLKEYERVLPCFFQARNKFTTTSDVIFNYSFLRSFFKSSTILLFGYNYPTYLIVLFLSFVFKKRCILFCESTINDKKRSVFKYYFKKFLLNIFFDDFIVPGKASYDYLLGFGISKDKVNIATNSYSSSFLMSNKIKNKKIHLVFVGRFSKEKNIEFMCEALSKVKFEFKINLVGDGELKNKLEQKYLNDCRFEFLGHLEKNEIEKILTFSDVIILPSFSETWGLVINEAICFGNAVLCSDNVGCRHELVDGNGGIFSPYDEIDFLEVINDIVNNLEQYQKRSFILSQIYTFEYQAENLSKIIRNI